MTREGIFVVAGILLFFILLNLYDGQFPIVAPVYAEPEVERKGVSLTVYNGGFGMVRDRRLVRNLAAGEGELRFVDVAAKIEPHTVRLRSLTNPDGVRVLAQDFLFDLVSVQRLLEKQSNETVEMLLEDGKVVKGRLQTTLSNRDMARGWMRMGDFSVIIKDEKEEMKTIPMSEVATIRFEGGIGTRLVTRPTLKWLIDVAQNAAGINEIEFAYVTRGLRWLCDYDLVFGKESVELVAWLTLTNNCGAGFENANLKLVAGDVHRPEKDFINKETSRKAGPAPEVKEREFFEYHMYEVARPITVRSGETKQMKMFEAGIKEIKKVYRINGSPFMGMDREIVRRKSQVILMFNNSKENGLGIALPAGRVRLFVPIEGESLFARSSVIQHTPKDEMVELPFGESEAVVWRIVEGKIQSGQRFSRGMQELIVRNLSDEAVDVQLWVRIGDDWKITESSHKFLKKDAQTAQFDLVIEAAKEVKVKYSWERVW